MQVFNLDTGSRFVFDKDVFPRFRVFLVVCAFREADTIVFGVVLDAVLLPRHRATRVFFVDAAALLVVVVFFAIAGRIIPVIITGVLRVEGFS